MRDILKEIVDRRITDIKRLGEEFGFEIPNERTRPVNPFLKSKGVILEVKRASPSKGDIAPELDSAMTANEYATAGASAISCLTEKNYFKGTLGDLMKVCAAVDSYAASTGKKAPAVLRKDFLVSEKEIDVSYRAGADAVLLIARILEKDTMLAMARKAASYGMSVLIEVRKEEDLEKLSYVMKNADCSKIVCGVNSRDLKDFTIDTLIPAMMLNKIKALDGNARVIFESGILSPQAASRVAAMDFHGMLLGEAASRNPALASEYINAFKNTEPDSNGKFWIEYAGMIQKKKPLVKICGITDFQNAMSAAVHGADILGFIMCSKSKRNIQPQKIREIKAGLEKSLVAGKIKNVPRLAAVITETDSTEAKDAVKLAKEKVIDVLQVHGYDAATNFLNDKALCSIPHYCAVNVGSEDDIKKLDELFALGQPRVLVDALVPSMAGGTGERIASDLVQKITLKHKLLLAGGINPENVRSIINDFSPELIDVSSGVEISPGVKDEEKISLLFKNCGTVSK